MLPYLEKGVFVDIIKLRILKQQGCAEISRWALNAIIYKGEKEVDFTDIEKFQDTGLENWSDGHKPRNAGSDQKLEEAREKFILGRGLAHTFILPSDSDCRFLGLQNC